MTRAHAIELLFWHHDREKWVSDWLLVAHHHPLMPFPTPRPVSGRWWQI